MAKIAIYKDDELVGDGEVVITVDGVEINLEGVAEIDLWEDALDEDDLPEAALGVGDDALDDDGIPLSSSEEPPHSS